MIINCSIERRNIPSYFFTFRQHDLQLLSFSFSTNNSSRLWRRRQELESARKWTGAIIRECNLPSPLLHFVRLAKSLFRVYIAKHNKREEGRWSVSALWSRHNRSRITTRGRRRVGRNSPLRSIIHTRDGRCWFSFDLCCAAAATRVVSCQSTTRARSSDRRMGGGEILEETAVQYICRK